MIAFVLLAIDFDNPPTLSARAGIRTPNDDSRRLVLVSQGRLFNGETIALADIVPKDPK